MFYQQVQQMLRGAWRQWGILELWWMRTSWKMWIVCIQSVFLELPFVFGDNCSHHCSGAGLCFGHLPCYLHGFIVAALPSVLCWDRFCVQASPQIGLDVRTRRSQSGIGSFGFYSGFRLLSCRETSMYWPQSTSVFIQIHFYSTNFSALLRISSLTRH